MAIAIFTREVEPASPYIDALAPLGLEVVAMPVTATAPVADPDVVVKALQRRTHDVAIAASARGARALVDALARSGEPAPECWAVGHATAAVFRAGGREVIVPPDASDGAALVHALLARRELAGARVLIVRPEIGREEAATMLRDLGAEVEEVVAYRTIAVAAGDPSVARGIAAWPGDVICMFAPSQVAAAAALVPLLGTFVAIGQTTAAVLREHGVEPEVARTPTPEGIANAIAAVYPARR